MKAIDFSWNSFQNIASSNSIIDYTANIKLFITDFCNNPIISQQLGMLRDFEIFGDEGTILLEEIQEASKE